MAIYGSNSNGLYDMAGNVAEWTSTVYTEAGVEAMNDLTPMEKENIPLEDLKKTWMAKLNDDNPVVRVDDQETAIAYGSPWSGKTPCYKNLSFPVGAIVKLHQYPSNRIKPLSKLHGYIAIAESVSGKTWDKAIAEGQHQTKEAIVKNTEVYYLDCLPDRDAA